MRSAALLSRATLALVVLPALALTTVRPAAADEGDDALQRTLARVGYVVERSDFVTDNDVLADPGAGLLFVRGRTRAGEATLAIDADDFRLRAVSPITGLLALDPRARRLVVDDPRQGLHVLAADGLREERFVPLPPAARRPFCNGRGMQPPPQVDARSGRVYVIRGSTLLVVDPANGTVVGRLEDVGRTGVEIAKILVGNDGRRLYVAQPSTATSVCPEDGDIVTTLTLPGHRILSRRNRGGNVISWSSTGGELSAFDGNGLWRERDGVMQREWDDWGDWGRILLPDPERHRILVDAVYSAYWVDDRTLDPLAVVELPGRAVANYGAGEALDVVTLRDGALGRTPVTSVPPPPLVELPEVKRPAEVTGGKISAAGGKTPFVVADAELFEKDADHCAEPSVDSADNRPTALLIRALGEEPSEDGAENPPTALLIQALGESTWRNFDAAVTCWDRRNDEVHLSPDFAHDGIAFRTWIGLMRLLLRTGDGGRSWQPASGGIDPWAVPEIAFSPDYTRDRLVLAATGDGRGYRSVDRGLSWRATGPVAGNFAFAPDYPADRRIFALSPEFDHVVQSVDAGRTWRKVGGPELPPEPRHMLVGLTAVAGPKPDGGIALFTTTELVAYGNSRSPPPYIFPGGEPTLLRSLDGGRSWQSVFGPLTRAYLTLPRSVRTAKGLALVARTGSTDSVTNGDWPPARLLRSDDLGSTWRSQGWPVPIGVDPWDLTTLPDGGLGWIGPYGWPQRIDLDPIPSRTLTTQFVAAPK